MYVRSFMIQGSFNYRTLIGTGFAFALLPALRAIYVGRPAALQEALRRHVSLFNSHPYLAGVALGGVAALERDAQTAAVIDRFKLALRGSLGTLGDRLIWAGWRPTCLLLALALFLGGAPWWLATGAFLLLYNAGHLTLRTWGLHLGLREGLHVGERLRSPTLLRTQQILPAVSAFVLGLLVPLAATGEFVGMRPALPWVTVAAVAAAVGVRFGGRVRGPLAILLAAVAVLGVLLQDQP